MVGNHKEWEFESRFDANEVAMWLTDNLNLNRGCALLYLGAVFAGQKYMENHPKYVVKFFEH